MSGRYAHSRLLQVRTVEHARSSAAPTTARAEESQPRSTALASESNPAWRSLTRRLIADALRRGASLEEAEDAVQEAILVVVRQPGWHDRDRASLRTALGVVVRNRLTDRWRHQQMHSRKAPALRVVQPGELEAPDVHLDKEDARTRRRAFLAALTPDERRLFRIWMRQRAGELRGPAAAQELGQSVRAFEAAKKRLRRRCRAVLSELGLGPQDLFGEGEGR